MYVNAMVTRPGRAIKNGPQQDRPRAAVRAAPRPARGSRRPLIETASPGEESRSRQMMRLEFELTALRAHVTRLENKLAATAANAEHYSSLFNNSPVGDVILDERGMILDCNRQARLMLGVNAARPLTGTF